MQVATSGHEIFPSLMCRPARRAVFSIHSPIVLIDAFCIVSGVFFDKISGWRWTSDIACSGNARRRYCPLDLEKRAVRNIIKDNDCFVIFVSLSNPPRIALPTAGYKGLFSVGNNKVNIVVAMQVVFVLVDHLS